MLLDTSGLLCLISEGDVRHEDSVRHFERSTDHVTHSLVLAEFVPLAHRRRVPVQAALQLIEDLLLDPLTETYWVDGALFREGLSLLRARPDKSYSLCDAVSFLLMRERGLTEALTTDHHFDQEGFKRLLDR